MFNQEKPTEEVNGTPAAEAPPAKGGKNAAPVEEVEEAEPIPDTWEAEVL